jgi:hypothetical protein
MGSRVDGNYTILAASLAASIAREASGTSRAGPQLSTCTSKAFGIGRATAYRYLSRRLPWDDVACAGQARPAIKGDTSLRSGTLIADVLAGLTVEPERQVSALGLCLVEASLLSSRFSKCTCECWTTCGAGAGGCVISAMPEGSACQWPSRSPRWWPDKSPHPVR